jgi:hypothetical protein
LFGCADSGIDSASGTDAGVLREFSEHSSPPQNRVALASATLSDSPVPKIAFGDFSRASSTFDSISIMCVIDRAARDKLPKTNTSLRRRADRTLANSTRSSILTLPICSWYMDWSVQHAAFNLAI